MIRGRMAYFDMSWDVVFAGARGREMSEVTSNLPDDARLTYLRLDDEHRTVRCYFEAASLDMVPETGLIPEFPVAVTVRRPE